MKACPLNSAGDLQLESVLSPLLFFQTDFGSHDTMTPASFHGVRILDFGCGSGRLLDALSTYGAGVLGHIEYVGWDTNEEAVATARSIAERYPRGAADPRPLGQRLGSYSIELAPDDLGRVAAANFDVIVLVNVIHHLEPTTALANFLRQALRLLRRSGYLLVEDFFLGEYPPELDTSSIYFCRDGVYFGPAELSSVFCSGWGAPGTFRFFKRRRNKHLWYGYTYVLRNAGRAMYFPGYNHDGARCLPGIKFALTTMRARAAIAGTQNPWYSEYAARLAGYLAARELDNVEFHRDEGLYSVHDREGLERIYDSEDPYPGVVGGAR
jgi:SAM-dependent methyltransferase